MKQKIITKPKNIELKSSNKLINYLKEAGISLNSEDVKKISSLNDEDLNSKIGIISNKIKENFNKGINLNKSFNSFIFEVNNNDPDDVDDYDDLFDPTMTKGIEKELLLFTSFKNPNISINKKDKIIFINIPKKELENILIKNLEDNLGKGFNDEEINIIKSKINKFINLDDTISIPIRYNKEIESNLEEITNMNLIGNKFVKNIEIKNIPMLINLSESSNNIKSDKINIIHPIENDGKGIEINSKNINDIILFENINKNELNVDKYTYKNGNLHILNDVYKTYNIDKILEYKYDNFINPITKDILLGKNIITSIEIEKNMLEDGNLKDLMEFIQKINKNDLNKLLMNYKNIITKYKNDLFIDTKIVTKIEDIIRKFDIFTKNIVNFENQNDINEKMQEKLKNQILKELEKMIESINEIDDYFNSIKNKEVAYIEENIGENGLLRKQFENSNIEYNFTPLSEETLKFLLDGFRRHQNICFIGHSGIGKTHACKFGAKILKMPYIQKNGHSDFGVNDLLGTITQNEKGVFELKKGPLIQLVEFGGVLILDEFNAIPQEFLKSLNDLLHRVANRDYGVWNTEIFNQNISVKVNPNFRILFTGNPSSYTREYGNLAPLTTDFLNRVEVKEFPPIELYQKNAGNDSLGNAIVSQIEYPMLNTFFENIYDKNFLAINNKHFNKLKETLSQEEYEKEVTIYLNNVKNHMNSILTSLLTALGRGFINKESDVNSDLSNFFVLVGEPADSDGDEIDAIKNVSLSIPNIITRPLKEIMGESKGNYEEDINKYLESSLSNRIGGNNTEAGKLVMETLKELIK